MAVTEVFGRGSNDNGMGGGGIIVFDHVFLVVRSISLIGLGLLTFQFTNVDIATAYHHHYASSNDSPQ